MQQVFVSANGDYLLEPDEAFFVNLTLPTGATILDAQGIGIIGNDDLAGSMQFSHAAYSAAENGGTATITVTRSNGLAAGVTMNYATSNGTATAGLDYQTASGTVTFNGGETSKTFDVTILDDQTYEGDETVNLTLSNPGGGGTTGTPSSAVLTITENDPPPSLSINNVSQNEGASGTSVFSFTVNLASASNQTVTVNYTTANVTTTTPSDYLPASGTLTFNPGDLTRPVSVQVNGDPDAESNEVFRVNLSNPVNATISSGQGSGTIVNDDDAGLNRTHKDLDGDGKADILIWRPAVGEWWYIRSSDGQTRALQFGTSADQAILGDFTGDRKTDIAFFRPATGQWFILRSEDGSYFAAPFGANGDLPSPGDYDGDGVWDLAVFRPATGVWYILRSTDGGVSIVPFGQSGDYPVP
jgi:hypothetical protein